MAGKIQYQAGRQKNQSQDNQDLDHSTFAKPPYYLKQLKNYPQKPTTRETKAQKEISTKGHEGQRRATKNTSSRQCHDVRVWKPVERGISNTRLVLSGLCQRDDLLDVGMPSLTTKPR